ncbi:MULTISPECIES: phage tail assembly chaperone [Pelosinus]|uniref:XkdN-like protein n=1 Tax=Pelosinus fermentans B4 TaxID=1149862 RepID=I9LHQ3_9FIRM|nr:MULTISPECIES: hypothetical protein [Pelosinus]EIW19911.1 XkdN-like protein [Pelosinus fermentans B4]EIW21232.1 hypothetical protein FA11_0959 [Pelosinus fermentans A11]
MEKQFITLDEILTKDNAALATVKQSEFESDKVGLIPFTAISHDEYKAAKKSSMSFVKQKGGRMAPEMDDDKLMVLVIIAAVDKDTRSDFTFASKKLFDKLKAAGLEVNTAEGAVKALLSPGEIHNFAIEVQDTSGFGPKTAAEDAEEIKNS